MDFAFAKLDRTLARPLGMAPDFPVLLAALSAHQAVSPTALVQLRLGREGERPETMPAHCVASLFGHRARAGRDGGAASFNAAAAQHILSGLK